MRKSVITLRVNNTDIYIKVEKPCSVGEIINKVFNVKLNSNSIYLVLEEKKIDINSINEYTYGEIIWIR